MPVFQLQYGEAATFPFVQATSIGFIYKWLLLTDHDEGSKMAHKAMVSPQPTRGMYHIIRNQGKDCNVSDLSHLTELDLSGSNLDIKPVVSACPQLQRLNLQNKRSLRLEDLQVIATSCHNLQGLNLMKISVTDIEFCLKVWEILSGMKLTYLSLDVSFVGGNFAIDDPQKKQLIAFFKQCATLRALEFHSDYFGTLLATNSYQLFTAVPLSIT